MQSKSGKKFAKINPRRTSLKKRSGLGTTHKHIVETNMPLVPTPNSASFRKVAKLPKPLRPSLHSIVKSIHPVVEPRQPVSKANDNSTSISVLITMSSALASRIFDDPEIWFNTLNSQLGNRRPKDLMGTEETRKVYNLLKAVDLGLF